jgi:transposase
MVTQTTQIGYRVSDEMWAKIEPLLPKHINRHPELGGRPRVPDRRLMDGILFVLRTGCQWHALDATGICAGSTAHDRFVEWTKAGVFRKLWQQGLRAYDAFKGLDWAWQAMDGAMTKAPLGGEKNGPQPHGSGQGRRQAKSAHRGPRRAHRFGGGPGQPTRL